LKRLQLATISPHRWVSEANLVPSFVLAPATRLVVTSASLVGLERRTTWQVVEKRSHADADHYNGLPDLLERFSIGAVRVASGFASAANPEAVRLLDRVRARGVPVESIAEGTRWEAAGARFAVWHPPEGWHPDARDNARSIVLDLESEGRHALLTGDLEEDGLFALVSRPSPAIEVFLAPHHGGRTANPRWLYVWARPAQVIVSQRPPAPGTRDALAPIAAQGTPLLRTWQRGAVRLAWSAQGITAQGFRDENHDDGKSQKENVKQSFKQ
jgi:competence protein ComEC